MQRTVYKCGMAFSTYQLVFGQNPNIPDVMTDKPPALHGTTISQVVSKHMNVLHTAKASICEGRKF